MTLELLEQKIVVSDGKITAGVEDISPDKAKALLASQKRNRPMRRSKVLRFLFQMRAGHWQLNGEPIIIDSEGHLVEGQHRLQAVVEFGKPVKMMVVHGVAPKSSETLNTGTSRTRSDVIYMHDERATAGDARIESGALGWLWKMENQRGVFGRAVDRDGKRVQQEPTPQDLLELARKHPQIRDAVVWARGKASVLPGFRESPMAFLYYVCVFHRNASLGRKFFGQLISGANLAATEPCYHLRQQMLALALGRAVSYHSIEYLAKAIKAWNATRNGDEIALLSWKRGEGFPEIE